MQKAHPEYRLSITIGASPFENGHPRRIIIWKEKKERSIRKFIQWPYPELQFTLALQPQRLYIADMPIGIDPEINLAQKFIIDQHDSSWRVNDVRIAPGREYSPRPLAGRSLSFTIHAIK